MIDGIGLARNYQIFRLLGPRVPGIWTLVGCVDSRRWRFGLERFRV